MHREQKWPAPRISHRARALNLVQRDIGQVPVPNHIAASPSLITSVSTESGGPRSSVRAAKRPYRVLHQQGHAQARGDATAHLPRHRALQDLIYALLTGVVRYCAQNSARQTR